MGISRKLAKSASPGCFCFPPFYQKTVCCNRPSGSRLGLADPNPKPFSHSPAVGSYSVLGGAALLVYQQQGPVSDNIMAELPSGSAAQEPLLLFITMATLFTYPLAVSERAERRHIRTGSRVE